MSVERLCLGTAKLGMPWYGVGSVSTPSSDEIVRILEQAQQLGITHYDTGAAYGDAEDWARQVLRSEARVVTKVSVGLARIGGLFSRLGDPFYQAVLLHNPRVDDWDSELARMVRSSRATLGASVYTPDEALAAMEAGVRVLQVPYCLLDQRHDSVIAYAHAAGVTVYARQPFLQGLLSNEFGLVDLHKRLPRSEQAMACVAIDQMQRACLACGVSLGRAALEFAFETAADRIVFGVGSVAHLRQVVGWATTSMLGWPSLRAELLRIATDVPSVEFGSLWGRP